MPFVCFCVEDGSNRGSRLVGSSVGGSGYVVWRTDSREWCAHNLKRYGKSENATEQKPRHLRRRRQQTVNITAPSPRHDAMESKEPPTNVARIAVIGCGWWAQGWYVALVTS